MQETLHGLLWVLIGSAFGGATRFLASGLVGRRIGETFPWGTMFVNVTGSFAIGTFAALAHDALLPHASMAWQAAVTGFLGSYTTVSSFSLQTLSLVHEGEHLRAGSNVVLTLGLCLTAAALGYAAGAGELSLAVSWIGLK